MTAGTAIAFTWDADIYCYDCMVEEWGEPKDKVSPFIEHETWGVAAVFEGAEFNYLPYCHFCTEEIEGVTVITPRIQSDLEDKVESWMRATVAQEELRAQVDDLAKLPATAFFALYPDDPDFDEDTSVAPMDVYYILNGQGTVTGVQLQITVGGPNIWVDTHLALIMGFWGSDRYMVGMHRDVAGEITDWYGESFLF